MREQFEDTEDEKSNRRKRFIRRKGHDRLKDDDSDRPRGRYKRNNVDFERLLDDEDDMFGMSADEFYDDD